MAELAQAADRRVQDAPLMREGGAYAVAPVDEEHAPGPLVRPAEQPGAQLDIQIALDPDRDAEPPLQPGEVHAGHARPSRGIDPPQPEIGSAPGREKVCKYV